MTDNLEKLKILADNIQAAKLGKRGSENHVNSHTVIDEYQEWRTESENLFEKYFDNSNALYEKFRSLPRNGNGYTLMNYFSQQYPIFKVLIEKIEEGEIIKSVKKITEIAEVKAVEEKTIFISHASKDKEIVDAFVDIILQGALSVPIDKIFCVSTDGTRIKSGEDWRDSINESLLSAKVNFLIITPNYKESEVCLNEMGAAWVTSATVLPLIVDPINYKTVGVIQEPNQIEKLLDEKSLDRIRDIIQEKLQISIILIKSDRWTAKKNEFLQRIKKHLTTTPFAVPMDRDAFNELIKENADLKNTVKNLTEEKNKLESLLNDLKKTKDKTEVSEIIRKHNPTSQFQDFETLCNIVKKKLEKNAPIINGIIFKSYSRKDITIKLERYRDEIDEALANDFIDEDLDVKWGTTKEMREIKKALDDVSTFLDKNLKDDFYESYNEKFDNTIEIRNKIFWEDVFDASISFT